MDLIDKRDEILRIFLEYGITENTENDLTKTDLADCAEQIVKKLILSDVGCIFLDELIEKHKANKKIALDNLKTMKGTKEYPWYDASFNNELLFVFDLEDLKIRLGL